MTSEQLQRGNELREKIKELESFKKAFNNEYVNCIRAETEKEAKRICIHRGDELNNLINDYVDKQLRELKTEFENL